MKHEGRHNIKNIAGLATRTGRHRKPHHLTISPMAKMSAVTILLVAPLSSVPMNTKADFNSEALLAIREPKVVSRDFNRTRLDFPKVNIPLKQTAKPILKKPAPVAPIIKPKAVVRPKPVVRKPAVKPKVVIKRPSVLNFSPCSDSHSIESGIHLNAIRLYRAVCHAFPAVGPFGGYRYDTDSLHYLGRAVDCMVPNFAVGNALRDWVFLHRKELKVMEIIWRQHIWTTSHPYWRLMEDRGSPTANHMDHVHVSLLP